MGDTGNTTNYNRFYKHEENTSEKRSETKKTKNLCWLLNKFQLGVVHD